MMLSCRVWWENDVTAVTSTFGGKAKYSDPKKKTASELSGNLFMLVAEKREKERGGN
jgi:hypothetical protein